MWEWPVQVAWSSSWLIPMLRRGMDRWIHTVKDHWSNLTLRKTKTSLRLRGVFFFLSSKFPFSYVLLALFQPCFFLLRQLEILRVCLLVCERIFLFLFLWFHCCTLAPVNEQCSWEEETKKKKSWKGLLDQFNVSSLTLSLLQILMINYCILAWH